MAAGFTAADWYYATRTSGGQQVGPLTWEQLFAAGQTGAFGPDDLVWSPQYPDWVPAAQIQGLLPQVAVPRAQAPAPYGGVAAGAPGAAPYQPAPSYQPAAPYPAGTDAPRSRSRLLAWLVPVIAVIIVGAGLGTYFGFFYDKGGGSATEDGSVTTAAENNGEDAETGSTGALGTAEFQVPDPAKLIETTQWGEVPVDQIVVVLVDGAKQKDVERVAEAIGGTVVGEIEYINLYQMQLPSSSEAELQAALATAQADDMVELASVSEQIYPDAEIWGVPQSPLDDPAYEGNFGKGYEMIGVQKAWKYMKGSGMQLWGVNVGVVDSGLYTPSGEFEGDVNITYPTQGNGVLTTPTQGETKDGVKYDDPDGSHGTAVAGIIGADAENGGQAGIASVLGTKLTISVVNQYDEPYGSKQVPADPNDPTVVSFPSGKSYAIGGMAAIIKQVEAGAKVINCSWGNRTKDESPTMAAAYRKLFEKMAAEHPDVLFVCSAGNDGAARDGSKRYPSGQNLPNMITVGNVMNDGTVASSSNKQNTAAGQEYEVTMAAPGDEAVRGVGEDGHVHAGSEEVSPGWYVSGGTSMAAPQVSAAAALLLSINPNLTAGDIKDILTETARPGPAELGGKTLAIDAAVLEVINQQREKQGLPAATAEELEKGGMVDAVATTTDDPMVYSVRGILTMVPQGGTELVLSGSPGVTIEQGEAGQSLTAPGEVTWPVVRVAVNDPQNPATITVTRKDNGASSIITLDTIDLNGKWVGTYTFTNIVIDEAALQAQAQEAASSASSPEEGCAAGVGVAAVMAILQQIQGTPIPMTMEITADMNAGTGQAVIIIDMSSLDFGENVNMGEPEPTTIPFTFVGQVLTFQLPPSEGSTSDMTATVTKEGDVFVLNGTLTGGGVGYTMTAVIKAAKEL